MPSLLGFFREKIPSLAYSGLCLCDSVPLGLSITSSGEMVIEMVLLIPWWGRGVDAGQKPWLFLVCSLSLGSGAHRGSGSALLSHLPRLQEHAVIATGRGRRNHSMFRQRRKQTAFALSQRKHFGVLQGPMPKEIPSRS